MLPFVIPPLVRIALGALAGTTIVLWAIREMRRINDELDRLRRASVADPATRGAMPTLRRDPQSDEWRVT